METNRAGTSSGPEAMDLDDSGENLDALTEEQKVKTKAENRG